MRMGGLALCASRLLPSLLLILAIGCGGDVSRLPGPTAQPPRPRPGAIIDLHPECGDADQVAPLVALGCREGCLPRTRPQVVCVDDPPDGLLGLDSGALPPRFASVFDRSGACAGFRIVALRDCKIYDNVAYSWAKHPDAGDWCSRATEITAEWGWFEKPTGGKGRLFCRWEEFVPNEL